MIKDPFSSLLDFKRKSQTSRLQPPVQNHIQSTPLNDPFRMKTSQSTGSFGSGDIFTPPKKETDTPIRISQPPAPTIQTPQQVSAFTPPQIQTSTPPQIIQSGSRLGMLDMVTPDVTTAAQPQVPQVPQASPTPTTLPTPQPVQPTEPAQPTTPQISDTQKRILELQQPSQQESQIQKQIDVLASQQANINAAGDLEFARIENDPTMTVQIARGKQAQVNRQLAAQQGALTAQQEPLLRQLSLAQQQRSGEFDRLQTMQQLEQQQQAQALEQQQLTKEQAQPEFMKFGDQLLRIQDGQVTTERDAPLASSGLEDLQNFSGQAEDWASLIKNKTAKLSDVPSELRTQVAQSLADITFSGLSESDRNIITGADISIQAIDDIIPNINSKTAGFLSGITKWKEGTDAFDLNEQIITIKANIGFDKLQAMRDASPTGGALGQVSERELEFLQSTIASLDTGQSPEQLIKNLGKVKQHYSNWKGTIQTDNLLNRGYSQQDINTAIQQEGDIDTVFNLLSNFSQDLSKSQNGSEIGRIANAIGQFESGGNYKAIGPAVQSGMYKGDKAQGKYQIMSKNIPSWSKEALGKSISTQEFINNPKLQDQIAQYKMNQYYQKYGNVEDVASMWFSGRPVDKAGNAKDVLGTTVPQYIRNIRSIYNKLS